jgi:hypothetical protein
VIGIEDRDREIEDRSQDQGCRSRLRSRIEINDCDRGQRSMVGDRNEDRG